MIVVNSAIAMLGAGTNVKTIAEAVQMTADEVEALRK